MISIEQDNNSQFQQSMFTFKAGENPILKKGKDKIGLIPDIKEPSRLFPLPPLPFCIQAAEPLLNLPVHIQGVEKYQKELKEQGEKHKQQIRILNDRIESMYESYNKEKQEHQYLKQRYKEGEYLFNQIEAENHRLHKQIQALKSKKTQKSRVTLSSKPKEVPVVKINVPHSKSVFNESERQSIYRQMKAASQQLTHMKKILESEKQKAEHIQMIFNKNIEQLTIERDSMRQQIFNLREENRIIKEENKVKSLKNESPFSAPRPSDLTSSLDSALNELQRIKIVHKSCNVLISSKQIEINDLKKEREKLLANLKERQLKSSSTEFTIKKQSFCKENNASKFADQMNSSREAMLELHLELSVKEIKSIEMYIKMLVTDFIKKIDNLKSEVDWANKKADHQKFELQRVYELLKDKKAELEVCYNDLMWAKKSAKSLSYEQKQEEENFNLKAILKDRRDLSA